MKIEEVENLEKIIMETPVSVAGKALSALRAEAWHPIEKAAELGAKDGREILFYGYTSAMTYCCFLGQYILMDKEIVIQLDDGKSPEAMGYTFTHFRFITSPEGA